MKFISLVLLILIGPNEDRCGRLKSIAFYNFMYKYSKNVNICVEMWDV